MSKLLKAAQFTVMQIEERIKLKQLPVSTRMLLLGLMAAINSELRSKKKRNG